MLRHGRHSSVGVQGRCHVCGVHDPLLPHYQSGINVRHCGMCTLIDRRC